VRWKKVTLIGVGLLGGSLGLALRKRRLAGSVFGFVRRAASVKECQKLGVVDRATRDLERAVVGADLIVLCTPIAQMRYLLAQMLPFVQPGAMVTDVGSVKGRVARELEPLVARAGGHFVGSHPMAGAEKMGVAAARADLFVNALCVITPTRKSNRAAVAKVERLWRAVGCRLLRLTPERHDQLVSRSSHLPHVTAATLASLVLDPASPREQAALCANGFRDTTRIASGSPEMWRDIALANRRNLCGAVRAFVTDLRRFQHLLERGNGDALSRFFERSKKLRDGWAENVGAFSTE
jgi:prephenate dehydrogenase